MQLPTSIAFALLVGLASAAPVFEKDSSKILVTKDFFPESLAIYSSEHDIVNMYVPINGLNFKKDDDESEEERKVLLFFVEADQDEYGNRDYRGLYVFKDGVPKKLLEGGRDAAAANDYEKDVYLAAHDGIYWYNYEENVAEKYGSITDSIIGIAKETDTDVIYILTEDKKVYRVTEDGNKKEWIEEIGEAEQIILDYENNLYYYGSDKQPYVYNEDGVKKIEGAPIGAKKVQLLKPPLYSENVVPFVADGQSYVIYADGYAEEFDLEFEPDAIPTAYAMEATLMQYFAIDKTIYEFDLAEMMVDGIYDVIEEILESYLEIIKEILALDVFNFN
ncbi:unnamed protein product, partial [Iphiclides podalirius]